MKKVVFLVSFVVVLVFVVSSVYATKNFNSSKSNTSSISQAGSNVTQLVHDAGAEAMQVAAQMIKLEQAAGYRGQVKVHIKLDVQIERVQKSERSER